MEYIIYNGVDSRDFGLYLVNNGLQKSNLSPAKQSYVTNISGIDGSLFSEQKYKSRTIPLRFKLANTSVGNKNMVMSWLGQIGEHELIISYENYKVYKGTFEDEIVMDNYMNGGIFEINFILYSPIAKSIVKTISNPSVLYNDGNSYDTGLLYGFTEDDYKFQNITTQTDVEIYNGSTTDGSLPIIEVNGSADELIITQFKSEDKTQIHRQFSYGSFSGSLVIDSEVKNTFLDGALKNETSEGRYLKLFGKTNWRSLSNGRVTSISTNTIEISKWDSDVDDIYNNQVIILRDGEQISYYKISDYDGTTKTITIDGSIENIDIDYSYTIYDVADGLNYIRIDGTNLNLTDISFDFNFLYL